MTWYKYTDRLDKKIKDYCFANFMTINELFNKCWLSWATYYQIKKRWVMWLTTTRKLDKILWFVYDELWKEQ